MLDEPDSHIHLDNKKHIIDILEQYKDNRQFIVTTHSPTLTKCIKDLDNDNENRVYVLDNGKNISTSKTKQIEHLVGDFWNLQEQTVFLSSHKNMILLVEGKHDKEHIINAWKHYKNDYPTLDFDVFDFGGETNLVPMLIGLREANFFDKKYIAVFDNDSAGCKSFNKDKFDKKENFIYAKLKDNNQLSHSNLFGTLLPKKDDHNGDFTIENMFCDKKYQQALSIAFANQRFDKLSIEEISKNIKINAKNQLANMSKEFVKEDFDHFKKLFDILNEINNIGKQPQDISNKEDHIKQKVKETNEAFRIGNLITEVTDAKTYEESFIPIYGSYKNKVIEAKYDLNSKNVVYNELVGSPSAMANQAVWDMGAPKTSTRNGLTFWKYEKGRDLKDLHEEI
ncbi:AAA domain protein [Francisella tularensis subsp. novicida]|nr:AAA domain protein [Francisella tularensis subsp. novicida]